MEILNSHWLKMLNKWKLNPKYLHRNSQALPLSSQPTDIIWNLIDTEGNIVDSHTETLVVGEEFTWETNQESPMRGSWQLTIDSSQDVNVDQTTMLRMSYAGYLYNR